jgi:hypothetical protein
MTYRVFLAHPKALGDTEIDALRDQTHAHLSAVLTDRTVIVTPGRDEHAATFRRAGTWDAWARDVARGVEYGTGEARYHAFVVAPSADIGRATEGIIRHALAAGKPVLLLAARGFTQVRALETPAHGGDYYVSAVCVS